jgi:hypothetical protein
MSRSTQYKCDECGKIKGEANHWFECIFTHGESFEMYAWGTAPSQPGGVIHLCGLMCATKRMQKVFE